MTGTSGALHDFITSVGAQTTAITAIAVAVGWWGRRVILWVRKMRAWAAASRDEQFAAYVAKQLDPKFDAINTGIRQLKGRVDVLEEKTDHLHADLRVHMTTEDQETP